MHKTLFAVFGVFLLGGAYIHSGERPMVKFGYAEIAGFVVVDEVDQIAYYNTVSFNDVDADQYHVMFWQDAGGATMETLKITAGTAQQIAEEAEPYLMLAKRGRRFEETASVAEDVEMRIAFADDLTLEIAAAGAPHRFVYAGDKAALVVECLLNAESVSREWVGNLVCSGSAPAPARQQRPSPRDRSSMERSPAPTPSPAGDQATGDEAFAASEIALRPLGMPGFTEIRGRLTNNSGRDVPFGILKLSFFDDADRLVGATDLIVQNFRAGETVTFTDMTNADLTGWTRYTVRLDSGF